MIIPFTLRKFHNPKYGMMRKHFLKEHLPIPYCCMLLSEKLYPHCREIQQQAHDRLDMLMEYLTLSNPPPDKATDGLAWAAHMGMLHRTAEEIIFAELIYE
jgi:hypothetical protein